MSTAILHSKYTASVWDVVLTDKTKENVHSCGAYTASSIASISKKFPNDDIVKRFSLTLLELKEKMLSNDQVINSLVAATGLDQSTLKDLAEQASYDNWPFSFSVEYNNSPQSILFVNVFTIFDSQMLMIDALVRTGALMPSQAKQLQKRFIKPLRAFMQLTASEIKAFKMAQETL